MACGRPSAPVKESGSRRRPKTRMAGRLAPLPVRQRGSLQAAGRPWRLRLPCRGRRDFRVAKDVPRRGGARTTTLARGCDSRLLLLLLLWHGKRRPVLPCFLRAHVVPSNEECDGVRIVNGLNGNARRGRMERASGLHDLPDDRKAGHSGGGEARGALGKIDGILDVLGDDEVGIAGPVAPPRETMKSVIAHRCSGVRASRNDGMGVPLSPVLMVRKISSRDDPPRKVQRLREVGRPYRMSPVVHQGRSRRSVAATDRAVALDAAVLLVELLPERRLTPSSLSARSGEERASEPFRGWRSRARRS